MNKTKLSTSAWLFVAHGRVDVVIKVVIFGNVNCIPLNSQLGTPHTYLATKREFILVGQGTGIVV